MDLQTELFQLIRKERLIEPGERVLVGVSGGIDSATLLHLLAALGQRVPHELAIAHVNHLLRGDEADRDEAFVRSLGARLSIPVHVRRVDVKSEAKASGRSVQHMGRDIRYAYFDALAAEFAYDRIAIAHNLDDQVETFILRMVKGTGIRGLSAIPVKRGKIIRPLLHTPRASIEAYARGNGITWVDDSSNTSVVYERNYVRNRVVPLLETLNPRFRSRMVALLADLTTINTRFGDAAAAFLAARSREEEGDILLPLLDFKALEGDVRYRVIALVMARLVPSLIPLREHILLIDKALASVRPNVAITLPHGVRMKKVYDTIVFTASPAASIVTERFPLHTGDNRIPVLGLALEVTLTDARPPTLDGDAATAFFDASKTGDLSVRTFRDGDRFYPLGMDRPMKLKDYFISRKVPRERRRFIPLLLSEDDIIWVVGERIDDRFKVTDATTRLLEVRTISAQ